MFIVKSLDLVFLFGWLVWGVWGFFGGGRVFDQVSWDEAISLKQALLNWLHMGSISVGNSMGFVNRNKF